MTGADLAALLPTLPVRNEGRFGRPGDPWNLLFIGGEETLRAALEGAGWTRVAGLARSLLEGGVQLLRGERLTRFPPLNTYRLRGRPQDQNWVRVLTPIVRRHHFRLWRLADRESDRPLWWGSANFDLETRLWDLSHVPDPDADAERDFIAETLEGSPRVERLELLPATRLPRAGSNDKGYPFRTDGRVLAVWLRG